MGLLEIIGDILDKSLRRNLDIAHHDKDRRRNPKYNCDACERCVYWVYLFIAVMDSDGVTTVPMQYSDMTIKARE